VRSRRRSHAVHCCCCWLRRLTSSDPQRSDAPSVPRHSDCQRQPSQRHTNPGQGLETSCRHCALTAVTLQWNQKQMKVTRHTIKLLNCCTERQSESTNLHQRQAIFVVFAKPLRHICALPYLTIVKNPSVLSWIYS